MKKLKKKKKGFWVDNRTNRQTEKRKDRLIDKQLDMNR